jgi:hypothetical protein
MHPPRKTSKWACALGYQARLEALIEPALIVIYSQTSLRHEHAGLHTPRAPELFDVVDGYPPHKT